MTKSNFAQRLNQALDLRGFPPKNRGRIQLLAELIGLTHRGASKWVNGETCPPAKKYALLAEKLSVNANWLKTGQGAITDSNEQAAHILNNSNTTHSVKVYHVDTLLRSDKLPIKEVYCDLNSNGQLFAIELQTEAMSPRFPNQSIIIFDDEKIYKDGDFVLIKSQNFPHPLFRQLLTVGASTYLNAHNPKFDRITLDQSDVILGVMVQAILVFN
ncbi:helix-turn-helix domain-containing protein [Thiotrichales bacterium 19S3-7]|nr:helix-turn-helix domain-containing protein [Thiotrichales bacterium 19S3-7]MCF6802358.1 helix-turn-helix domain-containing protein [Thiotrichales bacterium 19S3-11]